jgi:hypothetical protein
MSRRIASGQRLTAFITSLACSIYSRATKPVLRGLCCPRRRTLADLDDRLLADIGVLRSEVTAAAHGLLPLGRDFRDGSRRPTTSKPCASFAAVMGGRPPRFLTRSSKRIFGASAPPRLGMHETGEHR